MAVDFSQDIKTTERQMNRYVNNGQKVPRDVLSHYTNLLSGTIDSETVEKGKSDNYPEGDISSTFTSVSDTDSVILTQDTNRDYIMIQNLESEAIYINFGAPSAVNGGLKLSSDASWSSEIPQFAQAEIHAITATGSSNIAIYSIGA